MNGSTRDSTVPYECGIAFSELLQSLGQFFYIHNITETSFKDVKQVPNFYSNAWPSFLFFIILENVVLYCQRKPIYRLNDSITSLSHGLIQECGRLIFRGSETAAYIYIYNNWRLVELPWDSPLTWYITLLAVDFLYYWVHRASHEIHIFWAQHQVHHSSEEFNIAVGVRQSILQGWCSFIFYLPMAFFVPPAHFITHQQFNLLYQVWIHTNTIKTLGPLEYVLNTPQHHRVHHGCNIYCLDKNYGGVFIIWDRLFKTFAEEKQEEGLVYGLVHQEPSFNPFFLQIFYNKNVVEKFKSMKGFRNKLYSIVKGPSWMPGSPWTGFTKDKIDIKTREVYDVKISFWSKLYVSIHFIATFATFQHQAAIYLSKDPLATMIFIVFIIFSLTTIGMILDNHPKSVFFEMGRCIIFILYKFHYESTNDCRFSQILFCLSAIFWSFQYLSISKRSMKDS